MNFIKIQKFLITPSFLSLILILGNISFTFSSQPDKNQPDKTTLAQIADKIITVGEFQERNEFTIKPGFLKSKYTALNNLISEKILAIEAEKNNNPFLQNAIFQGKIKGIKEQEMRDELYNQMASNKVITDTNEINKIYRHSQREYDLEFFVIDSDSLAAEIKGLLNSSIHNSDGVFAALESKVGKKPQHTIKYLDTEDDKLIESLYTNLLDTGTVIGPVKVSNGDNILMKVTDWKDYAIIGREDQQERWKKVEEKVHLAKSGKLWGEYINQVMGNKKIEFNKETADILADFAFEYIKNNQVDSLNVKISEVPLPAPKIDLNATLFTIKSSTSGKEVWTVGDFRKELVSHPLVYRTKILNKENFSRQFQLAILDMVRDYFLTEEAYKKSYDTLADIKKTVETWRDSYLAVNQQVIVVNNAVKSGLIKENDNDGKKKFWISYLNGLQQQHSSTIKINREELKKINLTKIDVMAIRPGVPFPLAVPSFPFFITSENLDYASQRK